MSQSASRSLCLVSLSSLCSAAFSACLSLCLVTAVSRLSGLLFHLLAILFASVITAVSQLSALLFLAFLFASSVFRLSVLLFLSLVSSFPSPCSHRSRSNSVTVAGLLHEPCSHSLRLGHHHCPSIVKIRCTPHYMGLAQARPSYWFYIDSLDSSHEISVPRINSSHHTLLNWCCQ